MHQLSLISKTTGGNDVPIDAIATTILSKHRTLLSGSRAFIAPKYGITTDYDIVVDFVSVTFTDIKNVFDTLKISYSLYRHINTPYAKNDHIVAIYRFVVGDNHIDIIMTNDFDKHKKTTLFIKENFKYYHTLAKEERNSLYNIIMARSVRYATMLYEESVGFFSVDPDRVINKKTLFGLIAKGSYPHFYLVYDNVLDISMGILQANIYTDFDKLPDEMVLL